MDFYTDVFSILRAQILVAEANPENTERIGRETCQLHKYYLLMRG